VRQVSAAFGVIGDVIGLAGRLARLPWLTAIRPIVSGMRQHL
jgi:hypothetical protein